MKSYWEYVREYTEKTKNAKAGDCIVKPEIWIGLKFLDDNGIGQPKQPEEREKLRNVLNQYGYAERLMFAKAVYTTD